MAIRAWPRIYYFMSGLVYPGALGLSLTWFAAVIGREVSGGGAKFVGWWAVLFALWFTIYHSFLFARMMDRHDQWSSDPGKTNGTAYGTKSLWSDLIEATGLFAAFAALEVGNSMPSQTQQAVVFAAALAVPLSATIVHAGGGKQTGLHWGLIVGVAAMSLFGIAANVEAPDWSIGFWAPAAASTVSWCGLVSLWIALALYLGYIYPVDQ